MLVMGTAYKDLLIAFQISYFGSIAFGIGALLAIERRDQRGDVIACVLLVASLAFAEIALASPPACSSRSSFSEARSSLLGHRGPGRALRLLVPQLRKPSENPSRAVRPQPRDQSGVRARWLREQHRPLFGLGPLDLFWVGEGGSIGDARCWWPSSPDDVLGARPRTPLRRLILVPLAVGLGFWFMTAANFGLGRPPTLSRYQYVGAVFVLLIAGELAAGWRPGWRALLAAFAVAMAAAAREPRDSARRLSHLAASSATVRGGLAGSRSPPTV